MSFDFVKIFKEIDLYKQSLNTDDFMTMIINYCYEMHPDKNWELFKELDYTKEIKILSAHVIDTLKKDSPPFTEYGFWFGLSDNGYLYFAVSDQYIAEEDNLDWMFEAKTYYPEQGAFNSEILRSIEELAEDTELDNFAEYPLFLAYTVKLAQAAMIHYRATEPQRKVGYSMGYDSGDFITGGWL